MGNTKSTKLQKLGARRFHLLNAAFSIEKAINSIETAIKNKKSLRYGKDQFGIMNVLKDELNAEKHYQGSLNNLINIIDEEINELKK